MLNNYTLGTPFNLIRSLLINYPRLVMLIALCPFVCMCYDKFNLCVNWRGRLHIGSVICFSRPNEWVAFCVVLVLVLVVLDLDLDTLPFSF